MVACLLALIVFGILGIFSAKYRALAKQAFKCTFNMIRLRPCEAGMDIKLRSKVVTKLMHHNAKAAGFVYKHFNTLSTIFVVLLLASTIYSAYSIYNLVVHGSCDSESEFCILNPTDVSCGSPECAEEGCDCEGIGCEEPDFEACEGDCECDEEVCGQIN